MRRLFICAGLLAVFPLLWPSQAAGQKGKGAPKLEETTEEDYAALRKLKEISGKLVELGPEGKTLTLRYEYLTYEPKDPKGKNNQYNKVALQVQQQAIKVQTLQLQYQGATTARQQKQILRKYNQAVSRLQQLNLQLTKLGPQFKTVSHAKDFEFDLSSEVQVARLKPVAEYDDKGNIKEYTKEELKKMRSPDMPGYKATVEDLQAGQTVTLYLGKLKAKKKVSSASKTEGDEGKKEGEAKKEDEVKKPDPQSKKPDEQPKKAGDEDKKAAAGDKEKEKGTKEPPPPFVRQILIVADADPDAQLKTRPKRKKDE